MVGSVNVGVTVRAAAIEVFDRVKRLWLRGVSAAIVAGVADAWHPHFQQLWVAGAMRFVAIRAIFYDRWMFPQERSAAFSVTTQAVFVGRTLNELLRIGRAMWIVAARTGYFPFAIRHVRGALQLSAPHLMAPETQLRLRLYQTAIFREWGIIAGLRYATDLHSLLDLMAAHAGHSARLMRTAFPEHVRASRMTIHADGVLFRNGIVGIFAEPYRNRVLAAAGFHMRLARTVACFASTRFFGTVRIEHHRLSHSGVLEAAILIFMAGNAHLASDVAFNGRFRLRGCGLFLGRGRLAMIL